MLLVLFKKFIGRVQPQSDKRAASHESAEKLVAAIQQGDLRLRNEMITEYQPFVAKAASRFCKRYVDPSRDDEFSVALLAFNEAINQFSPEHGRSFLGFAETVIRRRLIDHLRKEQRFNDQIPYSSFDTEEEDSVYNPIEVHQAMEQYDKDRTAEERRAEIMEYTIKLAEFGITFDELVNHSPKHADSRLLLLGIARTLSQEASLMAVVMSKRTLPIKELLERVAVSRKTIERNRKYIIALSLVWHGHYPYLQHYLQLPNGDERDEGDERIETGS